MGEEFWDALRDSMMGQTVWGTPLDEGEKGEGEKGEGKQGGKNGRGEKGKGKW